MKYYVTACSRQGVRNVISKQDSSTLVISIRDPGSEPVFAENEELPRVCAILQLEFWDEIDDSYGCMSEEQAYLVAAYIMKYSPFVSNIIVNCEGGVSRSAGTAAAISKWLNGNDEKFFDYFHSSYVPNMTCYKRVLWALYNFQQGMSKPQ